MELNKIYNQDCLIGSNDIESGSVDLILTDPPYGTISDAPKNWTIGNNKSHKWDKELEPCDIYRIANRILRKNGKMILFSQEPYTTELIKSAIPNVPFNYRAIWQKNDFANALLCNKAMVGMYEDVLIFSKTHDCEGLHPLRDYALKIKKFSKYNRTRFYKALGNGGSQHFLESNKESSQFTLCTEETYNQLIEVFSIDEMQGFMTYEELRIIDKKYDATFNLWQGNKYKSNILEYRKDYTGYHPTQKPVLLLEDLIKTFSNEGDLVVDLTVGSGSTAVGCINTNRNYIVYEKGKACFDVAVKRIAEHKSQVQFDFKEGLND